MKLIAITGSIGCGKSTLANLLRKLGYLVYDVDIWTRCLYKNEKFNNLILHSFAEVSKNGKVDKRLLRNIVFNDVNKLRMLENLIHPFLKQKLKKIIRKNSKYNELVFIDAALIFELGWDKYCNFVIVADVDTDIQKLRVMNRDNISAEDFNKITKLQMKNCDKVCFADAVIDTNKSLGLLKIELFKLVRTL